MCINAKHFVANMKPQGYQCTSQFKQMCTNNFTKEQSIAIQSLHPLYFNFFISTVKCSSGDSWNTGAGEGIFIKKKMPLIKLLYGCLLCIMTSPRAKFIA